MVKLMMMVLLILRRKTKSTNTAKIAPDTTELTMLLIETSIMSVVFISSVSFTSEGRAA